MKVWNASQLRIHHGSISKAATIAPPLAARISAGGVRHISSSPRIADSGASAGWVSASSPLATPISAITRRSARTRARSQACASARTSSATSPSFCASGDDRSTLGQII